MELRTLQHHAASGWSDPLPDWDSDRTLVLAFGAPGARDVVEELLRRYPTAHVIGCSTAGEITGRRLFDDSVVAAVARFASTGLRGASAPCAGPEDSYDAGFAIASDLAGPGLRAVLVLSDGLLVNGTQLTRGLSDNLPPEVIVSGGLAGDGDRFGATWVLDGRRVAGGLVTAVGLYGDALRVGHGSQGGWDLFGPERLVTRSDGNVLYELDGRPALALYREYLGALADGLPATGLLFPLSLRSDEHDGEALVRTILAVDERTQSLTFAGDVPEGSLVRLMRANFDRIVDGAGAAGGLAAASGGDGPRLSIAVSCVGRRLVLGERTEEEIEAVLDALPPDTQQIGFYSYGELSPLASGRCDLHNQTMTLTTLSEAA